MARVEQQAMKFSPSLEFVIIKHLFLQPSLQQALQSDPTSSDLEEQTISELESKLSQEIDQLQVQIGQGRELLQQKVFLPQIA